MLFGCTSHRARTHSPDAWLEFLSINSVVAIIKWKIKLKPVAAAVAAESNDNTLICVASILFSFNLERKTDKLVRSDRILMLAAYEIDKLMPINLMRVEIHNLMKINSNQIAMLRIENVQQQLINELHLTDTVCVAIPFFFFASAHSIAPTQYSSMKMNGRL